MGLLMTNNNYNFDETPTRKPKDMNIKEYINALRENKDFSVRVDSWDELWENENKR